MYHCLRKGEHKRISYWTLLRSHIFVGSKYVRKKKEVFLIFLYFFLPFIFIEVHEKMPWSDKCAVKEIGYYGNSYHVTCHLWRWCAFYWWHRRRRASQTWSRTWCLKKTADFHTPHMCTPPLLCCLHIYQKTPCQHIQRTNIKGWYSLQSFDVDSYIIRKHWAPCWLDSVHGI